MAGMKPMPLLAAAAAAVAVALPPLPAVEKATTFAEEVAFLRQHAEVIVLRRPPEEAAVALVPAYQGRVMTSSASGDSGLSFGWVNRELVAAGKFQPHINVFGGEDRFWIGPEGGQFSIFFAPGAKFDLEHWFTPAPIDTEPFEVAQQAADAATFRRRFTLTNMSGTRFDVEVTREVRLLGAAQLAAHLGGAVPAGVKAVGFETDNVVRNAGAAAWTKSSGLLSIWILGMFNAAPATTVVVPFRPGDAAKAGAPVNDAYFGKVPAERLRVGEGVLFFRADANCRSKIGIPPRRAKDTLGSYDPRNRVLTIVQYTLPDGARDYVNSMWELQSEPFAGDVVNSYNDGPPAPGASQLGRFYELETSSPALALAPGQTGRHVHRTIHLQGEEAQLEAMARRLLGVGLTEIKQALR